MTLSGWGKRYDEAVFNALVWLFRIDEKKSYEGQPQWLIVLPLHALLNPVHVAFWFGVLAGAVVL